ncbi:CBS domain-containing protein [Stutzerimonas nitrititolerans]|uniref:CBS domain-containing protein n=1 Tax=Stutzerimonas nitrititolerans TaxID=2482751 RepID=UPI00289EDC8C|nr:CBS domain-containing protein [Stutzerimonas nitrititolerans]
MKIAECMTRDVKMVRPETTIKDAAKMMTDNDVGSLPVSDGERLVGMVTDRDIVTRAVCEGKGPDTNVREVMTNDVKYCFDDQDVGEIASNMADIQLHRLPVVNRDKRLVGIIALADVAVAANDQTAGQAVSGISQGV